MRELTITATASVLTGVAGSSTSALATPGKPSPPAPNQMLRQGAGCGDGASIRWDATRACNRDGYWYRSCRLAPPGTA